MRGRELLAASVAAALAGGCNFILGIEHDYEVGARRGAGGAGGAEEASASSSNGASVASSSGGTSSSSDATSSSSGSGGGGDGGGGGPPGCPSPTMVHVGAFCVDPTEVTNAAYAAWLATGPSVAAQPSFCAWNVDFTPAAGWPAQASEPVVHVDWCDAFAYCAAAGKRLCGRIGGGAAAFADGFADPQESEWMAACSNGGATLYPYGNGYVSGACDGKDYTHPNQLVAVGSAAVCHGAAQPYAAIFDLSGNVAEWEDACAGANGAGDLCRRRGGSFKDGPAELRCDADDGGSARSSADASTGFRCCGG